MPTVSQELRVAASVACVMAFAVYAFGFFGSAEAMRSEPTETANLLDGQDFAYYRGRLVKMMRSSKFAESCGRGQYPADTEVHVAMHFPQRDRPVTQDAPDLATADVSAGDKPKALILDSGQPTIWNVTGEPSAIVLTGAAILAEAPEGVPVFAPALSENCSLARWIATPKSWTPPRGPTRLDALMGETDIKGPYSNRATAVSKGVFRRDFASWQVRLGSTPFRF